MTQDTLLQADVENRLAALELSSFIVEAPAGAGKTELLTQRFLKLLPTVEQPEEIIAITFTNKAAAEMRLRILNSLIAAANAQKPAETHKQITYELSQKALQHAAVNDWQLIENPSRLRIFTIDSLCAHLARQMPLMSRFGAQPRVTDNADALYKQAAEQTLALLEHKDYSDLVKAALRYVDNDAAQLTNLLLTMLAKRDQWLSHAQGEIDAKQLQHTLRYLLAQALQAAEKAVPIKLQNVLMPIARFASANLSVDNNEQNQAIRGQPLKDQPLINWQSPLQAVPEDLSMWRALADFLLTDKGELRKEKGLNVKNGFAPNDKGKAQKMALVEAITEIEDVAALHRVRQLPQIIDNANSWQIIATLSKLLNIAVAQLWLTFQRAGEVDFVEIAQRAVQALSDNMGEDYSEPSDLALKLDYQIQHLLVDEFQDTSPSQVNLLKQLTQGWQANDSRTLFCVGDPMQSIYRFRKANVGLFISAAADGIGHIALKKLQLYRNNRSYPAVVDWINTTFATIFPGHDNDAQGAISYRPFIATKPAELESGIAIHAIIKQTDESVETASQREADAIVQIIRYEQQSNPNKKIAILVRSKKHLAALVTKLRREHTDIQFQAVEIEALQGRQIVQDLLSLTHALHHLANRVHWIAVLRAPWCGLTLHDLHVLAGSNHHATIWSLMQNEEIVSQLEGIERLKHVRDIFAEAFATQGRMATSKWLRGIWLMLNGTACLWEQADIIDVQTFFACLDKLERSNQFSPERMATEITKLFAAPAVNGQHIQMMSIHKSKGLEFDCVILPGLGASTGGNNRDKPLILWEEVTVDGESQLLAAPYVPKGYMPKALRDETVTAYDYIETLENERDANEAARVLYVAATRAERKLHLVGFATASKNEIRPAANTPLALLWPTVRHYFDDAIQNTKLNAVEATKKSQAIEDDISNFTPQLVRLEQLYIPSMLQTEKTTVAQANTARTQHIIINNIEADIGTLAHRYMQIIAQQGLAAWPVTRIGSLKPAMIHWLRQQGHNENIVPAAEQVCALLTVTLGSDDGQWVLKSRAQANVEFALTTVQNAGVKNYIIDCTFIEDGVRWIVDYKTIALAADAPPNVLQNAAENYREQLECYSTLFVNSGLDVKCAILFMHIGKLVPIL